MNEKIYYAMKNLNFNQVTHRGSITLLDHCKATGNFLSLWNEPKHVVYAGFFHSVYGRENTNFKPVSLEERNAIVDVVGAEAEVLAYLNCALTANSFWSNFHNKRMDNPFIFNRFEKREFSISSKQLIEILRINFANMVEHIGVQSNFKTFKWFELSLYIQYFVHLSPPQQQFLAKTFNLLNLKA